MEFHARGEGRISIHGDIVPTQIAFTHSCTISAKTPSGMTEDGVSTEELGWGEHRVLRMG